MNLRSKLRPLNPPLRNQLDVHALTPTDNSRSARRKLHARPLAIYPQKEEKDNARRGRPSE